jgi:SAM-dependent methyltransferase
MENLSTYHRTRRTHWQNVAKKMQHWRGWGNAYHDRLEEVVKNLVAPGLRVLELGCGTGDLLAAVKPSFGVGVDFSFGMLQMAKEKHPEITFVASDVQQLCLFGSFDVIILSDLINDLWDVQDVFNQLASLCNPTTRILINTYSRLWQLPLWVAEKIGLAKPNLEQNWFTVQDVNNLFQLTNFEKLRSWTEVLFPIKIPLISPFFNKVLVRFWPFTELSLTNFILARPAAMNGNEKFSVTVVVPARNEEGNIEAIAKRVPEMGSGTEIIFVEGNSSDQTYAKIQQVVKSYPNRNIKFMQQTGKGKGDAVRMGFAHAAGDILMILDADLTVPPEDLPRFYEALVSRKGDFINGVRLVYPMEENAMRPLNFVGNKLFSMAFTWLLGQPVKDTLCGTKVLWKNGYDRIAANRAYFGDFDPFGDFDLLFGAARQNLKIIDLPIRYRERTYGTTNIQRWKHGWLLVRMVFFALVRLKFI